jgi:hypothetical protein
MNTVIGICISTMVAICAIAVQFYVRWVPDIEIQKRQIKGAALWAWDILGLAAQAAALFYTVAHIHGPVTPAIVTGISLLTSAIVFCAVLIFIRRWILPLVKEHLELFGQHLHNFSHVTDRGLNNTDQLIKIAEQHLAIVKRYRDAFILIAKDPKLSVETARALNSLLDSECVSELSPRRLLSKGAAKKTGKSLF